MSEEAYLVEEEIFFEAITEYINKYRRYKRLDDKTLFLKSLEQGENV